MNLDFDKVDEEQTSLFSDIFLGLPIERALPTLINQRYVYVISCLEQNRLMSFPLGNRIMNKFDWLMYSTCYLK